VAIVFLNNPFDIILQATNELYPGINVDIQFDDRMKFFRLGPIIFGHCGETIFPFDNSLPLINMSTNIPFRRMPEILAHELAHVVVGYDEGHGDKWKDVFDKIYVKANEISRSIGSKNENT
jgi:hypothetical protein